mmetsp:Transcript_42100/g.100623  ORF Transcript_42100/g.100623 Transcript_42100/m.100623 type:complete len:292 (+) Transcript_42100:92-967(+)
MRAFRPSSGSGEGALPVLSAAAMQPQPSGCRLAGDGRRGPPGLGCGATRRRRAARKRQWQRLRARSCAPATPDLGGSKVRACTPEKVRKGNRIDPWPAHPGEAGDSRDTARLHEGSRDHPLLGPARPHDEDARPHEHEADPRPGPAHPCDAWPRPRAPALPREEGLGPARPHAVPLPAPAKKQKEKGVQTDMEVREPNAMDLFYDVGRRCIGDEGVVDSEMIVEEGARLLEEAAEEWARVFKVKGHMGAKMVDGILVFVELEGSFSEEAEEEEEEEEGSEEEGSGGSTDGP